MLLLAPLFLTVSVTRKIEIAVGFHSKILFQGKYAIPSGTTHYSERNCKIDIHYIYRIKELFKKLPTVKGEYVSSVFICLRRPAYICSFDLKSLNEHVHYYYEMDQYSAIC